MFTVDCCGVGILLCIFGVAVVFSEVFLYRSLASRVGAVKVFRFTMLFATLMLMLLPLAAEIANRAATLAADEAHQPDTHSNNGNAPHALAANPGDFDIPFQQLRFGDSKTKGSLTPAELAYRQLWCLVVLAMVLRGLLMVRLFDC